MNDVAGSLLSENEMLARFVLKKEWIRGVDNTIKQDAFILPKDLQLSVTRHVGISVEQLIQLGKAVAAERSVAVGGASLEFLGSADIQVQSATVHALKAVAWPLQNNPNHAHIISWPADKESRKTIAQELAAVAKFVPR